MTYFKFSRKRKLLDATDAESLRLGVAILRREALDRFVVQFGIRNELRSDIDFRNICACTDGAPAFRGKSLGAVREPLQAHHDLVIARQICRRQVEVAVITVYKGSKVRVERHIDTEKD